MTLSGRYRLRHILREKILLTARKEFCKQYEEIRALPCGKLAESQVLIRDVSKSTYSYDRCDLKRAVENKTV